MCGLIGIIGVKVFKKLTGALQMMQYRGYDSCGLAMITDNGLEVQKTIGTIQTSNVDYISSIGIAHTRWATHGGVSLNNTHPLTYKHFHVVHNGIIENYQVIKDKFPEFVWQSDTDTEVVLALLGGTQSIDLAMLTEILAQMQGAFAILILDSNQEKLYFFKKGIISLILGRNSESFIIGSDIQLFTACPEIMYLDKDCVGIISKDTIEISYIQLSGTQASGTQHWQTNHCSFQAATQPSETQASGTQPSETQASGTQPSGTKTHNTWFESEFYSQIAVLSEIAKTPFSLPISRPNRIDLIGCGSAYIAGLIAQYWFRDLAKIPTYASVASDNLAQADCLVGISQSGETADTLFGLQKNSAITKIAFTNNIHSSIKHYADYVIDTLAGQEKSVASTKATTAQMLSLLKWALSLSEVDLRPQILDMIKTIPILHNILLDKIWQVAARCSEVKSLIVIGRGLLYPIALEFALKIKELGYIHAEGMNASELKHGPLALVDANILIISLNPEHDLIIDEIKARGGQVISFSMDENAKSSITLPKIDYYLTPFIYIMTGQWLAYCIGSIKGNTLDMPRNLAKSVTVF